MVLWHVKRMGLYRRSEDIMMMMMMCVIIIIIIKGKWTFKVDATDKLCVNNRDETNTIRISEIYLTVPYQSGYWTMKLLDIVMVGEKGNWTRPRHYVKGNMLC